MARRSSQLPLAAEGEYRLVATCPGGGTSQLLSLGVDTTRPRWPSTCTALPAGQTTLGTELNDTSLSPGMQIALDVSTEPRASVLATGCGMTAGVAGQADASGNLLLRDVSVPPSGTCELQVRSTDLAGNTTTQTKTLTLALLQRRAAVRRRPQSGRYLGPADGVREDGRRAARDGAPGGARPRDAGTLRLLRGTTEIASMPVSATDTEKSFTDVALEEGANVLRAELIGPGRHDGLRHACCCRWTPSRAPSRWRSPRLARRPSTSSPRM